MTSAPTRAVSFALPRKRERQEAVLGQLACPRAWALGSPGLRVGVWEVPCFRAFSWGISMKSQTSRENILQSDSDRRRFLLTFGLRAFCEVFITVFYVCRASSHASVRQNALQPPAIRPPTSVNPGTFFLQPPNLPTRRCFVFHIKRLQKVAPSSPL